MAWGFEEGHNRQTEPDRERGRGPLRDGRQTEPDREAERERAIERREDRQSQTEREGEDH